MNDQLVLWILVAAHFIGLLALIWRDPAGLASAAREK